MTSKELQDFQRHLILFDVIHCHHSQTMLSCSLQLPLQLPLLDLSLSLSLSLQLPLDDPVLIDAKEDNELTPSDMSATLSL